MLAIKFGDAEPQNLCARCSYCRRALDVAPAAAADLRLVLARGGMLYVRGARVEGQGPGSEDTVTVV